MQLEGNIKNEGSIAEQLAKPQPPLNEDQLNNKEIVGKTIKKYQNKINEMLKLIQKQKKQNDNLKDELKNLNDSLNVVIAKAAQKVPKHDDTPREDLTKKQLDNEIKKNVALQKEVVQLRAKVKIIDGTKITQMHNQIKQKDKIIQELNQEIKTFVKVQKQQSNIDIYKREEQLNNKVNLLSEELLHIKKKLNQQKKQQEIQQKNIKRQHQKIISLQTKNKTSTEGMVGVVNKLKDQFNSPKKSESPMISDDYKKLRDNYQSLQSTKKATEKQLRQEIDNLKTKNKILEIQLQQSQQKCNRKQKQSNILISKMKQIQRKEKTLDPVEIRKSQDFSLSGIFDQRKQFKGLVHPQSNNRKFDDTESLSLEKNYKIGKFVFTWYEQHILSLDTTYQLQDGSAKEVSSFKIPHNYSNVKRGELILGEFEYLKDVEIYCNKWIQFLKIRTSRDKILEVGSDRNCIKSKKFVFDIRSNEKPIAFLGSIENKKNLGNQGKQLLISFGLEIKKKEVTGKTKFGSNPLRTQSIRKNASRSLFHNDKNTVEEHL